MIPVYFEVKLNLSEDARALLSDTHLVRAIQQCLDREFADVSVKIVEEKASK